MDLQQLCELGQQQLMRLEYLRAEKTLMKAESIALVQNDFDTLSRLYMPLQESRRQKRQRCADAGPRIDLIAQGPADQLDVEKIIINHPSGSLLVAGWGTIEPAKRLRAMQFERELFAETFLAAVYPVGAGRVVAVVPMDNVALPDPADRPVDELVRMLPAHSMVLSETELSQMTDQTFSMWDRLHAPFLAGAQMQVDPRQKIEGYRRTICVDYACELAHQNLSKIARGIAARAR